MDQAYPNEKENHIKNNASTKKLAVTPNQTAANQNVSTQDNAIEIKPNISKTEENKQNYESDEKSTHLSKNKVFFIFSKKILFYTSSS